ncbi:MAG: DUF4038 domain-containing protein [Eubacteriales bacterium]|nr:DUF4038 domain-containing protein [Eubacteriales bacterium]
MTERFRFPVRINREGGYFEDQEGRPFFWHGDTCWRIFWMMTYEEACRYLEDRAQKGFTVIQVHMLPHHIYQANVYGENPFLEPGKIDRLNEAYFAHADRVIACARSLGLAVAIAPMWLSVWEDDWYQYYHGEPVLSYARQLAQRYERFDNVIAFLHGGDDDATALHGEIRRCVPEFKKYAPHVLGTFHAGIGPGYPFFGEEDWYEFCMNYTYDYDQCIRQMREARQKYPEKPALLGETHYDGNDGICPALIRKFAYTSVLLGGAGHTYGNKDIWMATMFWPDALYTAAAQHMMVLREIFDGLLWHRFVPDTEGRRLQNVRVLMPNASDRYIPAAGIRGERTVVAYLSDRRYFTVRGKGRYNGTWIDPVSGRRFAFTKEAGETLQIPGHNADGSDDWLLLASFEEEVV